MNKENPTPPSPSPKEKKLGLLGICSNSLLAKQNFYSQLYSSPIIGLMAKAMNYGDKI
jgi:hypothetical protein